MNMDVRSTILMITILAAVAAVWMIASAFRAFKTGKRLPFFYKKRQQVERGIALVIGAILVGLFAFANFRWGADPG